MIILILVNTLTRLGTGYKIIGGSDLLAATVMAAADVQITE